MVPAVTGRGVQRKQVEVEDAKSAFSGTDDIVYTVDSIYRQFKPGLDFYGRLHTLDSLLTSSGSDALDVHIPIEVKAPGERPPLLHVRLLLPAQQDWNAVHLCPAITCF